MELVKKDIHNIDIWLQKNGIKYLDVRVELLDHLATEYEALDQYPDLESFLEERLLWCKKVMKNREQSTHWGYQRLLWIRFFQLLRNAKVLLFWALFLALVVTISPLLNDQYKVLLIAAPFITSYLVLLVALLKNTIRKNLFNNIISAKYLGNIFSVPILSIAFFNLGSQLVDKAVFFSPFMLIYVFVSTHICISAIEVYKGKRKEVLEEYDRLIKE